jgi:glycosyltransferase involved in cell wall biosynthesis
MIAKLVSIILPVYDQADHIGPVVEEYIRMLAGVPLACEFILVVNDCRDNSWVVCQALASTHSSMRVIHTQKGGWGRAIKLGLKEARGDLLCYTNSARTSASDLLLLILYAIANPSAVVKAHRRSRESLERKLGSFLFNLECRGFFDLPTWDINATPKVFSREVSEAIQLVSDDDLIDLEFYIKCKRLGILILEVPIYSKQRHGGQSTTSYWSAVQMYRGAFQMWKEMARGRAFPAKS